MLDTPIVSTTPLPDWLTDDFSARCAGLRCTNKAGRAEMVKVLGRLAEHYGATIEADPSPLGEKSITVFIRLNGSSVMIWLDGNSGLHRGRNREQGGDYLGHWNIERGSDQKFSVYFGSLTGSINQHHYCKATSAVRGFGYFVLRLAICLGAVMDKTAFTRG